MLSFAILVCFCMVKQVSSALTLDDAAILSVAAICAFIGIMLVILMGTLVCLYCQYHYHWRTPRFRCDCLCCKRRATLPDTLTFSVDRQTAAMLERLFSEGVNAETSNSVVQNAPIHCERPGETQTGSVNSPETRAFSLHRATGHEVVQPNTLTVDRNVHELLQSMYEEIDNEPEVDSEGSEHGRYQGLLESMRDEPEAAYQGIHMASNSDSDSDTAITASYENINEYLGAECGRESTDL